MEELSKRLNQYEFLKGVAIVFVLLLHSLSDDILRFIHSNYSIGQAVPLFILCTFVLSFNSLSTKKGGGKYWFSKHRIWTLFRKILKPFFIVQLLLSLLLLLSNNGDKIILLIKSAGVGPGSYYPWIYLQFWLLMPYIYRLFEKTGIFWGGCLLLIVNQMLQYWCSVVELSETIYRLLCFRYLFLSVFAYMILKCSIKPFGYILFFLIGIGYYICLDIGIKFTPWLYNSWMSQQLPAYFYTMVVFFLLMIIYDMYGQSKLIKVFVFLGKYSWKIFLLQMFVILVIPINCFYVIKNEVAIQVLYVLFVFVAAILPILIKDYFKK